MISSWHFYVSKLGKAQLLSVLMECFFFPALKRQNVCRDKRVYSHNRPGSTETGTRTLCSHIFYLRVNFLHYNSQVHALHASKFAFLILLYFFSGVSHSLSQTCWEIGNSRRQHGGQSQCYCLSFKLSVEWTEKDGKWSTLKCLELRQHHCIKLKNWRVHPVFKVKDQQRWLVYLTIIPP